MQKAVTHYKTHELAINKQYRYSCTDIESFFQDLFLLETIKLQNT